MKRIIVTFTALAAVTGAFAQAKTTKPATGVKKTAVKPAATGTQNVTDTFSYAIAMSTASFFKEKGINQVNMAMVQKAFEDVMKKNQPALTPDQMNKAIMDRMQNIQRDKTAVARKEGIAFLAANKNKPGVVTLPSGLQYQILKEGNGPKPKATDKVKVHYHGTLVDGTVFDSSVDRGQPISLGLNNVIAGWTEALQLMPVGSKWKLFIPSELGYGDRDAGPVIKGGSTLIFEVELLAIEAPDAAGSPQE